MQKWYRSNSLQMNPSKTSFILIGSHKSIKTVKDLKLNISGISMDPSRSIRLLGVVVDPVMTWDLHISHVIKKCNALLISLYRFRHHFSQDIIKLLIETHVFPHILYCLSVWDGAAKQHLHRIQKAINFAARIVTGTRRREQ